MPDIKSITLIRNISEIVIFSIPKYDTNPIEKGIKSLQDIATTFLEKRQQHPEKYEIINKTFQNPTDIEKNMYVSYVMDDLLRIFKIAGKDRNEFTCKQVIDAYFKILLAALRQKNNHQILENLFEHQNYYGSYYFQMLQYCMESNLKHEKNLLLRMLFTIPSSYLTNPDPPLQSEYVSEFIVFNMFRVFKLVIDKNDSEAFESLLDFSTNSEFRSHIRLKHEHTFYQLSHDPSIQTIIRQIDDNLDLDFAKDYYLHCDDGVSQSVLFEKISAKLESLRKQLAILKVDSKSIDESISSFSNALLKSHVRLLVNCVFFAVGAYLLYKGGDYAAYVQKLWYYAKPEYTQTRFLNHIPEIHDSLWQYCFCLYEGENSTVANKFKFGAYGDSKPYFYRYMCLQMIKNSKFIDLPTLNDIDQIHKNGRAEALEFWCEFFDLFSIQTLKEALDQLDSQFIKTIRGNKNSVDEKKLLLEKITKLENNRRLFLEKILLVFPVCDDLIDRHVEEIKQFRKDHSLLEKISNVNPIKGASLDFIEISRKSLIPREVFMRQKHISRGMPSTDYGVSDSEPHALYDYLISNLKSQDSVVNSDFLLDIVKKMKDDGFNPDVIFIPIGIVSDIQEQTQSYGLSLKLDGYEFVTIKSWDGWPFTDIVVYDSAYLNAALADDMSVLIPDRGQRNIEFVCTVKVHFAIKNPKAFACIHPKNYGADTSKD